MEHYCPVCQKDVVCNYTGIGSKVKQQFECSICKHLFYVDNNQISDEELILIERLKEKHRKGQITLETLKTKPSTKKVLSAADNKPQSIDLKRHIYYDNNIIRRKPQIITPSSPTERLTQYTFQKHLHGIIPKYNMRPAQMHLARDISKTLDERKILIAEAGVGTGKSLAYLIPALHYSERGYSSMNRPILICTKTIALQEQLVNKDIPSIGILFPNAKALLAKGQRNYLCKLRYNDALYKNKLNSLLSDVELRELSEWVIDTEKGDRVEGPTAIDKVWDLIKVEDCNTLSCADKNYCSVLKYKNQRANYTGIIVTNHNMLINDLVLRLKKKKGLWIEPRLIIIDEAHNLETSARNELSQEISSKQLSQLINGVKSVRELRNRIDTKIYYALNKANEKFMREIDKLFFEEDLDDNGRMYIQNTPGIIDAGKVLLGRLEDLYNNMEIAYSSLSFGYLYGQKEEKQIERQLDNVDRLIVILSDWIENPNGYFISGQKRGKEFRLLISPIDVSKFLEENLFLPNRPVILTSGTLTVNNKFEHIKYSLGVAGASEHIGQANLTSKKNVVFYIASDLPRPQPNDEEDEFTIKAAERIIELVKCSRGRSLVLFTSHRRLDKAYELLVNRPDIPWKILHQRDKDAVRLFREDETSILMATGSFWEGIDVVGESLTMVIMDKLPFPAPNDPLNKAKHKVLLEQGKNPIINYDIPEMLLKLRQGAGRLLRHEDDWGCIAILDPRAQTRYLKLVINSLPPHIRVNSISELKSWFNEKLKSSA